MKMLAVDDDEYILELLPIILAESGWEIAVATSARIALDMIHSASRPYDCFLLDTQMPVMDGIELCRRIRALPDHVRTPVIMLTAMTEKSFIDRAFEAGATDYATKPFDVNELSARLRVAKELIEARREAHELQNSRHSASVSSPPPLDLLVELELEGVRNLAHKETLKNYLAQLSRTGLSSIQLLAVKIDHFSDLIARGNQADTVWALAQVVTAIDSALRVDGYLVAYAGDGEFVCICYRAGAFPPGEIESHIQAVLDVNDATFDNGDPLKIEVSVGSPFRPSGDVRHDFERIFERAILRAELRAEEKREASGSLNLRFPRVPW